MKDRKKSRSVLEELYEGLHIDELLKEENDPQLEELIKYFEAKISAEDQMMFEDMLSRQSIQIANLYPKCFSLGVKLGYRLSNELEIENNIEIKSENESEEDQIRQYLDQGMSIRKVAEIMNIPKNRVEKIKKRNN